MKQIVFLAVLCFSFFVTTAQEKEEINLLVSEASWRKEAFRFPIPFAKEVDFDGVADVRFTKGWQDKNSPYFWSYAFAWKIALEEKLSNTEIENYMQLYFDGLMKVVNKDKSKDIPPTIALFTSTTFGETINYKGKIRIYDAFFTQDTLLLHVEGSYSYCKAQDKSIYIFKLSPKSTEDSVWEHLNKTVLRNDICN